jgi:hypothetical protein
MNIQYSLRQQAGEMFEINFEGIQHLHGEVRLHAMS